MHAGSRRLGIVAIAIALGLVLAVGAACLIYPTEYVWRVLAWRDADADDFTRFPMRMIRAGPDAVPLVRTPQPDRVHSAWRAAGGGPDMSAELASHGTQAFLVLRGDRVIYEGYFNGAGRESWVTSFSVAKSFLSVLVGIAIAEGHIASLEDPVTRYVPELATRDPQFARIRLRHLVDMTSGIRYGEFPFFNGDDAKTYYYPDLRRLALQHTEIAREPGEAFEYNNYNPLLLGIVLERATGRPVAQYLQERLWQPAGMVADASWSLDSDAAAFEKLESGINARAEDFARFGLLMLRHGQLAGSAVVPREWAIASTAPPEAPAPPGYYVGSPLAGRPGAYYRAFWWGMRRPDGTHDFAARGNHGQLIYVSPAKDVVIVRHGTRYGLGAAEWLKRARGMADAIGASGP